mmetsp:Transcript_28351/g.45508  ORF Transcript_28351/g.45508 Transcript_28351/m.45508 type:complete len:352 (+) Transcript_28351:219-1274(+)
MRHLPVLEVAILHDTLPDQDAVVLELGSSDPVVGVVVVIVIILLVFSPLDAPNHQLLVALDGPRTTLHNDYVGHARAGDAGACEVELLGVHVNLEQVPLVGQVLHLEDQHLGNRLLLSHPLLLLLLLTLLGRQPARLVSLLVLPPTLLHLLPHLPLHSGRVCDGLVSEDAHQVGHLDFGRWRLQDTHLNLITDLLSSLLAFQSSKLLALLGSQVHHRSLRHLLLRRDLDGDGVFHVGRDLLDVDLCIGLLHAKLVLLQEGHVPPLHVWDWLTSHHLWLDLLHRLHLLFILLFALLLFLGLIFLLLFVILLVNAKSLLLDLLHELLLLLHKLTLLDKPESPALLTLGPVCHL